VRHLRTIDGVTPTDTMTETDIFLPKKESDEIRQNIFCGRQKKQNVTTVEFCFIACPYICTYMYIYRVSQEERT
jgi:hypothetical protein